ncbi:HVSL domain-containing protein [Aspergillus puulaauensis]|uniref:U6 snRNA phosphodiesterase n=1 Tax=Aspergillus puulaauensis TaxID=1220207 RepID=A0A7R7XHW9_9EURO|nr:poly(U)-specific 3'-to-5' RNA exonuclease [Aspergillus puulaauensis]BCS21273.1 poly(U)-specific 3'-to-5' RNA exonuclease [Aspergillus puulaauensis]
MALVQYSDSESDSGQEGPPRKINKQSEDASTRQPASSLPPLPASFHDLYASSTRVSVRDDPSLHGGRKRAIPHVEGNWPTHVYLEWYPSKEELRILSNIITQAGSMLQGERASLHSFLHSDLGAQLPLHISLSRPVVLRTEQRRPFMEAFESTLEKSVLSPFNVQVDSLDWVSNFEKTRWFYVLRAKRPDKDYLNNLLQISNRTLASFGQPPLYKPVSDLSKSSGAQQGSKSTSAADYTGCFHISIAWSLTEPSTDERECMKSIDIQELTALMINFDCVKAKIGNNVSSIPL